MRAPSESSILDLKCELARRLLEDCVLCARRCGANRAAGRLGFCGLGAEAVLAENFIHIGEEPPINPSHLFSLAGCSLRCRFCQQSALLAPTKVRGTRLDLAAWKDVDIRRARSVSFIGGNPDESLPAILEFLKSAPIDFALPIVWNTHSYSSPETLKLLDGVIDVYLPDLKYGNNGCAERWSHTRDYYSVAQQALKAMSAQGVLIILRILVLPGHLDCCHIPALKFLASLTQPPLLSIRGQYSPDWLISASDGIMAKRTSLEEFARTVQEARSLGLSLIES
jgi:putative pyruvate formate lyase activating enzyme